MIVFLPKPDRVIISWQNQKKMIHSPVNATIIDVNIDVDIVSSTGHFSNCVEKDLTYY